MTTSEPFFFFMLFLSLLSPCLLDFLIQCNNGTEYNRSVDNAKGRQTSTRLRVRRDQNIARSFTFNPVPWSWTLSITQENRRRSTRKLRHRPRNPAHSVPRNQPRNRRDTPALDARSRLVPPLAPHFTNDRRDARGNVTKSSTCR